MFVMQNKSFSFKIVWGIMGVDIYTFGKLTFIGISN